MLIKCAKCGFENQMGAIFCRGCGEKIDLNALDPETLEKNKNKGFAKFFKFLGKAFSTLIVIAIIGIIASVFVTYGLPAYKQIPAKNLDTAEAKLKKVGAEKLTSVLPSTNFTMEEINILLEKRVFNTAEDKKESAKPAAAPADKENPKQAEQKQTDKPKSKEILDNIKKKFEIKHIMLAAAGKNIRTTVFAKAFGYIPLRLEVTGMFMPGNEKTLLDFEIKSGRIGYLPVPAIAFEKFLGKYMIPDIKDEELNRVLKRAKKYEMAAKELKLQFNPPEEKK